MSSFSCSVVVSDLLTKICHFDEGCSLSIGYTIVPSRTGQPVESQGQPSYWDNTGVYFIYWQAQMSRWAICDLKCLDVETQVEFHGFSKQELNTSVQ